MRKNGKKSMDNRIGRRICFGVCMILIFGGILPVCQLPGNPKRYVNAAYQAENASAFSDEKIEAGTLVIGTHLVQKDELNEEIYRLAKQSAYESGQMKRYYKTASTQGLWLDVTNVAALSEIEEKGTPVDNSFLSSLRFTHYTMRDGMTYELRTGSHVCIYDISLPYNMNNIFELAPLSEYLTSLRKKSTPTESEQYMLKVWNEMYETQLDSTETKRLDLQMEALYAYYCNLVFEDVPLEKRNMVKNMMNAVDAERRYLVYQKLYEQIMPKVQAQLDGTEGDAPAGYQLTAKVNQIMEAVTREIENTFHGYAGKRMESSDTDSELQKIEYALHGKIIEYALEGDQSSCDDCLEQMCAIDDIIHSRIVDAQVELKVLEKELLPSGMSDFQNVLSQGAGEKYEAAKTGEMKQVALDRLLQDRLVELDVAQEEIRFLILAKCKRLSDEERITYLESLMQEALQLQSQVKDDDFKVDAMERIGQYQRWLRKQFDTLNKNEAEEVRYQLDKEAMETFLLDIYGQSFAELSAEEQSAILVGLMKYMDKTFDASPLEYLEEFLSDALETENPYLMKKPIGTQGAYVAAKTISACTNYRYIYADKEEKAVLQKGNRYYAFSAYSTCVRRSKNTAKNQVYTDRYDDDQMELPAIYEDMIYLPVQYVETEFGLSLENLQETGYAVVKNTTIEKKAVELCGMCGLALQSKTSQSKNQH